MNRLRRARQIAYSPETGQVAFSLETEKDAPQSVALWTFGGNGLRVVFDGIAIVGDLAFSADGSSLYIRSITSSDLPGDVQPGIIRMDTTTGEYEWIIESEDVGGLATAPEGNGLVYTIDGEFIFSE